LIGHTGINIIFSLTKLSVCIIIPVLFGYLKTFK